MSSLFVPTNAASIGHHQKIPHLYLRQKYCRFRYNQLMSEFISSPSNPLVKQIRSLRQKKGRDQTGLFLVEGIHPVGEATESGWDLETLVYAPDLLKSDFALHMLDEQSRRGIRCVALASDLFAAVSGKDNPQGILAIIHQRHLALDNVSPEHFGFGAAVVSPQDPGNIGTLLRTLEAVGAHGLFLLDGGVEMYNPSVVRASMGTLFWIPVIQASFGEFVHWVRKNRFQLVGSSAHAGTDYRQFQWGNQPSILLLGNEQKGLSPEQIAACAGLASLPMKGRGSSLNLAVAAGVLLYRMLEN
jgi:TrmH family RNA methyltransferase